MNYNRNIVIEMIKVGGIIVIWQTIAHPSMNNRKQYHIVHTRSRTRDLLQNFSSASPVDVTLYPTVLVHLSIIIISSLSHDDTVIAILLIQTAASTRLLRVTVTMAALTSRGVSMHNHLFTCTREVAQRDDIMCAAR